MNNGREVIHLPFLNHFIMSRYFEDFTLKELINSPNEYVPPMQLYGDFLHAEELGILFGLWHR